MYALAVDQKEIGERLRQHRERAPKISLYRLATETKALTAAAISNYETGYRKLKSREAKLISEAFKKLGRPISAAFLLDVEESRDSREQGRVLIPIESYKRLAKIVALWAMLTDEAQAKLVDKVEELAESSRYGQSPATPFKAKKPKTRV